MEPEKRSKKLPEPPLVKPKERQPAPKPGTKPRPEGALAGSYAQQRDALRPGAERSPETRPESMGGGGAAGEVDVDERTAAKLPRKATILSQEAAVMTRPQFLGTRVALLKRGEEVSLIGREGAWYLCITPDGLRGYIHKWRVDKMEIKLRPGDTGSGTARGENETAGRG